MKLKQKYEGILKDSSHSNILGNESENEDDTSDEDVDAYDRFAGDDLLPETVNEKIASQCTNITGI